MREARLRKPALSADACVFLLLTALNLAVCWRLFKVEFTDHFSSIEGAFIGIARYVSRHWGDFSWWPLWHCGMPYKDTYQPLLHVIVAGAASLGHLSAARAYHAVVGAAYALGPGAVYLMTRRLGASRGAAFVGAALYSLISPSAPLMPDVARDVGGWQFPRRLQVLTLYGEGPHVSAMTLLPLVILALQLAVTERSRRALALAAIPIALVFLTNVPATMAAGLLVFCWICAQRGGNHVAAWRLATVASLLAYGLAAFAMPPSSLLAVFSTVGPTHTGFSNSLKHGPLPLALVLLAVWAVGWGLNRTRLTLPVRFAILVAALLAPLVRTADADRYELLPQVGRLHLEFELAASVLVGCAAWAVYRRLPRWAAAAAIVLCAIAIPVQLRHYRARARLDLQRADLAKRSEYTTAMWLDRNTNGGRVYAAGSTAFWLNAFSDTPQVFGCCDQNLFVPALIEVPYAVNSRIRPEETEAARLWLTAIGVSTLVVNGPASSDVYKDIQAPDRFAQHFELLHEENGDRIYSVLPAEASLAHVLRPGSDVPVRPSGAVLFPDVARYANTIAEQPRTAEFEWVGNSRAHIRARLRKDDLISVQVAHVPGWTARVAGQHVQVGRDGLGFLLLEPRCEGECELDLVWNGRPDLPLARWISVIALACTIIMWMNSPASAKKGRLDTIRR